MNGHGIRRALRRLLGSAVLHQAGPDYGGPEIDITLQRSVPPDMKVFKCRRCDGIKRAVYAPVCLGVAGDHQERPMRMTRANTRNAPADTIGLLTR